MSNGTQRSVGINRFSCGAAVQICGLLNLLHPVEVLRCPWRRAGFGCHLLASRGGKLLFAGNVQREGSGFFHAFHGATGWIKGLLNPILKDSFFGLTCRPRVWLYRVLSRVRERSLENATDGMNFGGGGFRCREFIVILPTKSQRVKLRANCKINIGLDVLRRRADGFHDVSTVMVPVRELYDRLEIEPAIETELVQRGLPVDCPPEDNICLRAWRLMHERYGAGPVRIVLDKRVPYGAGLGGGSADATAVVQGVDALFGLRLAEAELIDCAAALGSDTAFFVRNAPQLCTGRGEVMRPVKPAFGGYTLLIVKPDEAVSTREAYAGVRPAVPAESLEESMRLPVTAWQGRVKNDFEPHVFAAHPRLAELKESLLKAGAVYAAMSGSGSALFGLFDDPVRAQNYTPPFDGVFLHRERL